MLNQPLVYILDDDRVLCENTAAFLSGQGFLTRCFFDVPSLEAALAEQKCDVLLLDIMLPGESGLQFFRRMRAQDGFAVIFVTALGEETDRVLGLELGASDYLVKPFFPRELAARIRVVLRAQPQQAPKSTVVSYAFANWVMDPKRRLLISPKGVARNLTGSEFRLLRYFLEHPNQVLERDVLFQVISKSASVITEQALDAQISRLRACLGENASNQNLIKTSRGDGYFFASAVDKKYE